MLRPGGFWVLFWAASHSRAMAGGKKRPQGRSGSASAERAWRKTYCEEVDFAYLVQIQRVHFSSERPGEKSGLNKRYCQPNAELLAFRAKRAYTETINQ